MTQETYELLEERTQNALNCITMYEDRGSKERKAAIEEALSLVEKLNETDKISADYQDNEERRRIEEKRNDETAQIEKDKQKLTWQRVAFEIGKIMLPAIGGYIAYDKFQKRVMKYEETGKICSTPGRELHLPRFMK